MTTTTILRMNPWAYDVLATQHGWTSDQVEGTLEAEFAMTDEGEKVTVTMTTTACQSVDIVEAARHCIHTLAGWTDEPIEVLAHDGTAV